MSKRLTGLNPLAYIGVEPSEPSNMYMSPDSPTPTDIKNFNIGDFWVNTTSLILYVLVSQQRGVATWIPLSGGGSGGAVNFVTNSGVAVESAGTINVVGDGTTITTSGSGDTVTFVATGHFSSPITVPNGGTGDTSFTPYAVITGGVTSTSPLQNVAGLGTTGQVLTSSGAGALPVWAPVPGSTGAETFHTNSGDAVTSSNAITIVGTGGISTSGSGSTVTINGSGSGAGSGLSFIQKQTVSGATEVDFTTGISSTFNNYFIVFDSVTATSTGSSFFLMTQLSTNGGASYINTGYLSQGSSAITSGLLAGQFLNTNMGGTEVLSGTQNLNDLTIDLPSRFPASVGLFMVWDGVSSATSGVALSGMYNSTSVATNALRLVLSNGAAFSGQFTLYGLEQAGSSGGTLTIDGNSGSATPAGGILNIVGTGGITTSGSGSTLTINGSNVPLLTKLTLTSSQVKNLAGTPITLISAPGVNNLIIMRGIDVMMAYGGTNPFTASSPSTQGIVLYYTTNTNGNQAGWGVMGSSQYTQSNSVFQVGQASGGNAVVLTAAGMENEPIVIGIDSLSANIAGNAANDNTINIVAYYEIVDVTTYF